MSDFVLSEWLMENTITNEQILSITLYAIAVYTLLIALCWKSVSNRRRLSWCISLLNSFLMSIIGAVHFVLTVSPLEPSAFFGINGGQSVFHSMNNIGIFACTIFAVANVLDLVYGLIFYREQLGFLTTYFHHTMYTWLMVFSITGNGGFTSTPGPFTTAFMFCSLEEVPTFLLALGTIFPACRTDMGFGVTFFILRIVYHSCILFHEVYTGGYVPVICLMVLTLCMHLNWFGTWVVKYGGGAGKKNKKVSKSPEDAHKSKSS